MMKIIKTLQDIEDLDLNRMREKLKKLMNTQIDLKIQIENIEQEYRKEHQLLKRLESKNSKDLSLAFQTLMNTNKKNLIILEKELIILKQKLKTYNSKFKKKNNFYDSKPLKQELEMLKIKYKQLKVIRSHSITKNILSDNLIIDVVAIKENQKIHKQMILKDWFNLIKVNGWSYSSYQLNFNL